MTETANGAWATEPANGTLRLDPQVPFVFGKRKMRWAKDEVEWLRKYYPLQGKQWCVRASGRSEGGIRTQASHLGLKSMGTSVAWRKKMAEHGDKLRGRKRPEQALVMKALHAAGKLRMTPAKRAALSASMKRWFTIHEHPRGMLGKHHSTESRRRMSESQRRARAARSPEREAERVMKILHTKAQNGTLVSPRLNATWKAGWREIGGIRKFYSRLFVCEKCGARFK